LLNGDLVAKIIILIDRYLPILGGAQNNVHELAGRLLEKGYEVTVLTRKLGRSLSDQQHIENVIVKRFGSFPNRVVSKLICLLGMTAYLIRNVRQYDLILCVPCAYYSDILPAFLSSVVTKKPYVIRTTMSGNLDYMLSIKSETARDLIKKLMVPPFLFRSVLSRAALIVTQSIILHEKAISKHKIPNCELVLSGVNGARYKRASVREKTVLRQKLGLAKHNLIAITTGRYVRGKNIIAFVKAIESINSNTPGSLFGVILGATEHKQFDSNEEEIKEYVRKRKLGETLAFINNAGNVDEYLKASDIFVFPTMFDEGMSNSLLEAMSCGLPIIASNIPQVTGMFPPGEWLFFNPADVRELTGRLVELMDSEQRRDELGSRIEKYARENYSSIRVAEQYDELFKKILADESPLTVLEN
jgi:glycosyltransferase involved in cell wall biosynthesis